MRRSRPPGGANLEVPADPNAPLGSSTDRRGAAALITDLAVPALADCAIVLLPISRGRWEWWRNSGRTISRGRTRRSAADSLPVLTGVLTSPDRTITVLPAEEVALLPQVLSGALSGYAEVFVHPLPGAEGGAQLGGLLLAVTERRGGLDEPTVRAFAERAAATILAAQRFERQKTATDQLASTLAPIPVPDVPGVEFAALYRPAGGPVAVGGDFYDVHPASDCVSDGEHRDDGIAAVFLVGDVCGSGPPAAAVAGQVRHALAALCLVERRPARLLGLVNETVLPTTTASATAKFVSIVIGNAARRDGFVRLVLGSGGHPPPLVLRTNGVVQEIEIPGTLVGVAADSSFGERTVELSPGEICLLYTDGITEARRSFGRGLFGTRRLRAALAGCTGMSGSAVVTRIDEVVRHWTGDRVRDDVAMLTVRCPTEPAGHTEPAALDGEPAPLG